MAPKLVSLRAGYKSRRVGCSYVQILGTGMDIGQSPSVLLFFDNKRFLFNAGEGIQRFCIEHKIKLSKIDHVLFTRVSPETTGGLFGMLLTLAGEKLTVNVWGPPGLQHLRNAIRTFVPSSSTLHHTHVLEAEAFQEAALVVEEDVVKIYGIALQVSESRERSNSTAMVYICKLPDVPGRFDPGKAVALGVKPGKKYSELQGGMPVESDDGSRTIHPLDVMESSKRGPVLLLVDCPASSHLPALISGAALQKFNNESLSCVVHLSPVSVINEAGYQLWMKGFGSVQHILAGPGCCKSFVDSPVLKTSASLLTKLNLLCPRIFPMAAGGDSSGDLKSLLESGVNAAAGFNLLKFHLHPLSLLGLEKASGVDPKTLELVRKEFSCDLQEIHLDMSIDNNTQDIPACISGRTDEMEIVFLGTGSSHPSNHRNVSAIYIHLFDRGGVLLDCGEDTFGQLKRRYGDEAEEILINLKCVWISHIHADHQSGLARVLSARKKLLESRGKLEPLLLIGPVLLRRFLVPYSSLEDLEICFLDCSQTTLEAVDDVTQSLRRNSSGEASSHKLPRQSSASGEPGCHLSAGVDEAGRRKLREVLECLKLKSVLSVPVIHCPYSYGVVLEALGEPGWKFAYSGDTRPCEEFIQASRGATVFVHEATFDDELLDDALEKFHSLTCEAVQAGAAAGAYRTILTHFSQRYPRVPVFNSSYNDTTCVAFDMMSVNLVDLPSLPRLVPAFKLLFKDENQIPEEQHQED